MRQKLRDGKLTLLIEIEVSSPLLIYPILEIFHRMAMFKRSIIKVIGYN